MRVSSSELAVAARCRHFYVGDMHRVPGRVSTVQRHLHLLHNDRHTECRHADCEGQEAR